MIDVVIPLIKSRWEKEILYSLRSWEKNFQTDFKIHIVGNHKPTWLGNDVHFEHIEQTGTNTEENLASARKWCMDNFDEFIWSNDDVYLLKPITLEEIKSPLYLQDLRTVRSRLNNRWGRLLWKTADELVKNGETIYNNECHTPYYYESDKMSQVFEEYEIHTGKGLLRTAYVNTFYDFDSMKKLSERKVGFYSPQDGPRVIEIPNKLYLNHDDRGLTEALKSKIDMMFSESSVFEITY